MAFVERLWPPIYSNTPFFLGLAELTQNERTIIYQDVAATENCNKR